MFDWLLDFVFPPVCPHCGTPVFHEGEWCDSCLDAVCHIHTVSDHQSPYLETVVVLGSYVGGLKTILYDIKFNHKKERAKGVAPFLCRFNQHTVWTDVDMVIPVPVSAQSQKQRGWNQVDLCFRAWVDAQRASHGGWEWCEPLIKLPTKEAMWNLSRTERERNMQGAFLAKRDWLAEGRLIGKSVLVLDDIYTTGATLREVARVLHSMGATTIKALTIASGAS